MDYKRFLVLLLGLLFLLNALWGADARDYQDWEVNKKELVGTEGSIASADNKKLHNRFSTCSTRKVGLGGRKILAIQKGLRREIEKEQGLHGGASEDNSEKEKNDSEKSLGESQDQSYNQQNDKNNLERKTLSARLGTPRTEPVHLPKSNIKPSQDSKVLPDSLESPLKSDNQGTTPTSEMQRLLHATKEIVNLMHKDYSAHERPRRKPPINNNVPIH